jgi:hypothetical protein
MKPPKIQAVAVAVAAAGSQCAKLFWTASPRPVEIAAVQSIPVVIDRCVQSKKRLQSCIDYILF